MPHAARANSAERKILDGDLQQGVIDRDTARSGPLQNVIHHLRITSKQIQNQWPGALVDISDCILQSAIWLDGQDGSEDFFLHEAEAIGRIDDQGRRKFAIPRRTGFNYADSGGARLVEIRRQPSVLFLIDDGCVVWIFSGSGILFFDFRLKRPDAFIDTFRGHEHVVRRDTGLPGREEFSVDNRPRRCGQVGVSRQQDGGFPAELGGRRRPIP